MKTAILILFTLVAFGLSAQVGEQFPELKGGTLSEEHYSIPEDTKGKFTLLGTSKKKQSTQSWVWYNI